MFFVLIILCSITSLQAKDLNLTDSDILNTTEMDIGDDSQLENVNVSNNNATEFSSPASVYYNGNYDVTLKDSNSGNSLADKNVTLTINNVNYNAVTNSKGIASFKLNLNPGNYISNAYFDGDDDYNASNSTFTFKVLSTIKASNLSKYYKGSTQYTATFFKSNGERLTNTVVNVNINGKSYNKKTNSKGVVSLPVDLKPGTYKIIATDPLTGYKLTTTFKILSTISSSNINKVVGDSKKFTAKFYKSNGKALAKKYIKIKLNGKIHKIKTNSNGKATLSLNKLKKGTYKAICYNNDGLSKSYQIKIVKIASTKISASSYTFFLNETKQIKIKFTTSLNDDSKSSKTIKIKLNGKTYSKKTDSDGLIRFNLPSLNKGSYTVDYSYRGNKFFKASKSSNYITLLSNGNESNLKVKSTTSFGYGAGTLFKVAYTADSVPLAKRTVTFNVNGKTYTNTTNKNGIAAIPINLKIGNYTITYMTKNEAKVNGTSNSCNIDVFKRNVSSLTWKSGTSFKDSSQTFKVLLKDSNGKAISGQTIELIIDGEKYTAVTASNGYATFKTEVAFGNYKVSVKFKGNNNYQASSTSKSLTVKLSSFGNGLNQKNTVSYLKSYLKSSSYCKVGTSKMKALVKSLTKGLTNKIDKAKAIFNYVRDTLDYSYYYNSKYGASTTLKLKKGNCVDHSHLLVALYRTAGFKARYVHGVCHFTKSGNTVGHVWTQVLIGKTWVCGDPISYSNDLGKIKNWNTKTVKIHAKYRSLPF